MRQVIDKFIASREDTTLLVADLGRFPLSRQAGNLVDVGLSESLLVNVAAGLSLAGKQVYIYTVAGFTLYRALEQLKVCFQMKTSSGAFPMNIHILNGGAGFLYSQCGLGHYLIDDLALVQSLLPSFKISIPFDGRSTLDSLNMDSRLTYVRLCPDNSAERMAIPKKSASNPEMPVVWTFGWLASIVADVCIEMNMHCYVASSIDDIPDIFQKVIAIYDNIKISSIDMHPNVVSSYHLPEIVDDFSSRNREEVLDHYGFSKTKIKEHIRKVLDEIES